MADTYCQIYLHLVFAVKHRSRVLLPEWDSALYKYMFGIIDGKQNKAFIVNGCLDHVHILFSHNPSTLISDVVRDVKNNSTNYLNRNIFRSKGFAWQEGYGIFSLSKKEVPRVYRYIQEQKEHHRSFNFREEYVKMMEEEDLLGPKKYTFDWFE
ncbi:MAG: IS200/IS605 family transposase [Chitinophagales bacterium]